MFCPNCGKSDQTENTYCRQCGTFLPDFDRLKKKEISPETHFLANTVLNVMSGIGSLALAILLYSLFLGRPDTPPIIYITAGFLTAMFFWQAQIFWRTRLLKKQFAKRNNQPEIEIESSKIPAKTKELLNEADFSDHVPASVAENTTKNLREKAGKLSQS